MKKEKMPSLTTPVSEAEIKAGELVATTDKNYAQIAKETGLKNEDAVSRAIAKPAVRGYMAKYLDDAGATLEASAKVISDAHTATKITDDGDELPDHHTRLNAAELNLKIRGELKDNASNFNLFAGLTDEQLAMIASGQLDPASLIDVGPRMENPAAMPEAPQQPQP